MGERNYARFYTLLRRMPGADKETLVEQYTNGRTVHLHETTGEEYRVMCDEMEREAGHDERMEARKKALKKKRSMCLHLMQQLGVNTADWPRVDDFCRNPRVSGKRFAQLGTEELDALQLKLRMIKRHGGLKKCADGHRRRSQQEAASKTTTYLIVNMDNLCQS